MKSINTRLFFRVAGCLLLGFPLGVLMSSGLRLVIGHQADGDASTDSHRHLHGQVEQNETRVLPSPGLDYDLGVWVPIPDWNAFQTAVLHYDTSDTELVYVGEIEDPDAGGAFAVHQMFTGTSFDGGAVHWIWRSKPLLGEDSRTKRHEFVQPLAKKGTGSITCKVWPGFDDPDTETPFMETTFSTNVAGVTHVEAVIPIRGAAGEFLVAPQATYQYEQNTTGVKETLVGFRLGSRVKRSKRFS